MQTILLALLGAVWLVGAWLRIYQQARFYQIEEYMSLRYFRWWLSVRERSLPTRPGIAVVVGTALAVLLGEAPGSVLPALIALAGAVAAVWPPDEGEVKKPFRRTGRATRMLGAAFVAATLILAAGAWLLGSTGFESFAVQVGLLNVAGALLFFLAPVILALGNLLMTPVEGFLRGRFVAMARGAMRAVDPVVIGITGSYGKTTTKNYIAAVLNGRYRAYATPRSYNTMMGVCIAINNDVKDDYSLDYFVVEMGAYIRGEIARICNLTPPRISVVTEVGPQHLERFGSLENIREAKYEIIKALPKDGVGVFNWDNEYVRDMYERGYPNTRLAVSRKLRPEDVPEGGPRFVATDITETLDGLSFTVHDVETGVSADFSVPVLGEHNVTNTLLAAAIGVHEGMLLRDVATRARTFQPSESRLERQVTAAGITIINDAYSANPAGVVSSLRVLGMHKQGRRLLVTPGMVELGDLHEQENYRLGQVAAEYATDVILVGRGQTRPIYQGLQAAGFPEDRLHVVDELREAMNWYQRELRVGDAVLFLNDLPDTY